MLWALSKCKLPESSSFSLSSSPPPLPPLSPHHPHVQSILLGLGILKITENHLFTVLTELRSYHRKERSSQADRKGRWPGLLMSVTPFVMLWVFPSSFCLKFRATWLSDIWWNWRTMSLAASHQAFVTPVRPACPLLDIISNFLSLPGIVNYISDIPADIHS